eukprot:Amastigsp_a2589_13.p7 type:complete len:108 gc:universal Amastigsp_a2589_13:937-614(-)
MHRPRFCELHRVGDDPRDRGSDALEVPTHRVTQRRREGQMHSHRRRRKSGELGRNVGEQRPCREHVRRELLRRVVRKVREHILESSRHLHVGASRNGKVLALRGRQP